MIQPRTKFERANWEITAIALRCDYIGDVVTVMVDRDWRVKCAWYLKYKLNSTQGKKQKIYKTIKGKINKCIGRDCPVVCKYREKLIAEELGKT
jgi:hypothetical protein